MERVDRLDWDAGIAFVSHGASVAVRTNDVAALDRVASLLPPGWGQHDGSTVDSLFSLRIGTPGARRGLRNYHLLYSGGTRVGRTLDLDEIFNLLDNQIHSTVGYWARKDLLFVHAGVVGWQGRAILLPGGSRVGKTTLVTELIRAGATYYSDDMAVLDAAGRVAPYAVPLSVRGESGSRRFAPTAFGGVAATDPIPVGLVLLTRFAQEAHWRPRRVSPGRALTALLQNTIAARRDPRSSLPILRQLVERAPVLKTPRGDAADAAERIIALASSRRFLSSGTWRGLVK